MSNKIFSFDLTQRPPRSARVKLGGYVILPRMLDKCRALINGVNGDFNYACPLDQHFLQFAGIDADKLKEQVAQGKSDSELLEWIRENAANKPNPWEIAQWSAYHESRAVGDCETREFFNKLAGSISKTRDDIVTWFDLLDLDDYASYGGKV